MVKNKIERINRRIGCDLFFASKCKRYFKSNKFMNYTSIIILFISVFLVATPAGYVFGLEMLNFGNVLISLLLSFAIIPLCEIKKLISRQIAKRIF